MTEGAKQSVQYRVLFKRQNVRAKCLHHRYKYWSRKRQGQKQQFSFPEWGSWARERERERDLSLLSVKMGSVPPEVTGDPHLSFAVLHVPYVCRGTCWRGYRWRNRRPSRRRIWDLSNHLWHHLLLLCNCHSTGHNTRWAPSSWKHEKI